MYAVDQDIYPRHRVDIDAVSLVASVDEDAVDVEGDGGVSLVRCPRLLPRSRVGNRRSALSDSHAEKMEIAVHVVVGYVSSDGEEYPASRNGNEVRRPGERVATRRGRHRDVGKVED